MWGLWGGGRGRVAAFSRCAGGGRAWPRVWRRRARAARGRATSERRRGVRPRCGTRLAGEDAKEEGGWERESLALRPRLGSDAAHVPAAAAGRRPAARAASQGFGAELRLASSDIGCAARPAAAVRAPRAHPVGDGGTVARRGGGASEPGVLTGAPWLALAGWLGEPCAGRDAASTAEGGPPACPMCVCLSTLTA